MSQSREKVEMNIEAFITVDDHNEPQAVTVTGYGNLPLTAIRAIAEEALECHTGSVLHDFRVQRTPVEIEDESTVFEVYKFLTFTRP